MVIGISVIGHGYRPDRIRAGGKNKRPFILHSGPNNFDNSMTIMAKTYKAFFNQQNIISGGGELSC
jgi:hypothetical protein